MGQYLSAPVTEKVGERASASCGAPQRVERPPADARHHPHGCRAVQESQQGQSEALAFGLSAMQGWRVSMVRPLLCSAAPHPPLHPPLLLPAPPRRVTAARGTPSQEDAHISELALDGTPTALFSVFDGHGGKAVAKFCAKHMVRPAPPPPPPALARAHLLPRVARRRRPLGCHSQRTIPPTFHPARKCQPMPPPPRRRHHLPQSRELVALESYRRGDLGAALAEAYYRMDVLLDTEEGKAELNALIAAPAAPGSQG
jgi:hypothetical protein